MNLPHYESVGVIFTWILLTLAAFRLQRIVTADDWPPSEAFRGYVTRRFGADSSWHTFVSCPYCFGFWATLIVFAVAAQFISVPLPALQAVAASAVVGYAGARE